VNLTLNLISYVAWFGTFACFILVLIKQFESESVTQGIIGIITCGIWTFVWGWINARDLNIVFLMLIWTLLLAVRLGFHFLARGMVLS